MKSGMKSGLILAMTADLTACSSSTLIRTVPSGAQVYVGQVLVGTTPFVYSDTKIVGTTTTLKVHLNGYKELVTNITRNEMLDTGACAGGIFTLVPFFWIMGYDPKRSFTLEKE